MAYKGSDPFIFISYSHKDSQIVLPIIAGLQSRGFRVWYDAGIRLGTEWPEFIAEQLVKSSCVIAFISANALDSHNCRREINFAISLRKDPIAIHLESATLSYGMQMQLGALQAMFYDRHPNLESFLNTLCQEDLLKCCQAAPSANVPVAAPVPEKPASPPIVTPTQDLTPEEMYQLGKQAYDAENYEEAVRWLQMSADREYPDGVYALSECYMEGHGIAEDREKAVELVRKAAELGSPTAQWALGLYYQHGFYVEKNILTAIKWFRQGAKNGHLRAQYCLAECYHTGTGIPTDAKEALHWFYKSAEQGWSPAQFYVGQYYENGLVVNQDYETAALWYQSAAEQGLSWAQNALGDCYRSGCGVPQSYEEAVKWYRKAAEQHDADAFFSLALCYAKGNGVESNWEKSLEYYIEAAKRGHFAAQYNLGVRYFNGDGVEQDYAVAKYYFSQAKKNGMTNTEEYIEKCDRQLNKPNWWPF